MKAKHWKLGTVLLGALVLLLFMWGPEGEEPKPIQPAITSDTAPAVPTPAVNPSPDRRHFHPEECATCPDLPSHPTLESMKRSWDGGDVAEFKNNAMRAYAAQVGGCKGLLLKAVLDGDPNPDTSRFPEECNGKTPLHVSMTFEQAQELVDAGADVNARDHYGRTPLHMQGATQEPTEETLEIVKLLLESGADPKAKTDDGEHPWLYVKSNASTSRYHRIFHEKTTKRAAAKGLSLETYLDTHPKAKARLDEIIKHYLVEAQMEKLLRDAAVDPDLLARMKSRMTR